MAAITEYRSTHWEMLVMGGREEAVERLTCASSSATVSAISTNSSSMIFLATLADTSAIGLYGPRSVVGRATGAIVEATPGLGARAAAASKSRPEPTGAVGENVGTVAGR